MTAASRRVAAAALAVGVTVAISTAVGLLLLPDAALSAQLGAGFGCSLAIAATVFGWRFFAARLGAKTGVAAVAAAYGVCLAAVVTALPHCPLHNGTEGHCQSWETGTYLALGMLAVVTGALSVAPLVLFARGIARVRRDGLTATVQSWYQPRRHTRRDAPKRQPAPSGRPSAPTRRKK